MATTVVRLHALVLTASIAAFAAAGCSAPSDSGASDSAADSPVPAASGAMSTDTRYPELYREMRLPEAPDAEVMSTGRQNTSLSDGLALRVSTSMGVQAAHDFFSQALGAEGWTVQASRPMLQGIGVANVMGTKDAVTYTATFTSSSGATQIDINVVQN